MSSSTVDHALCTLALPLRAHCVNFPIAVYDLLFRAREMCFTASAGDVRRLPNGRIVQERAHQHPKPVTAVAMPAATTTATSTTITAEEETYSGPFDGLQTSPKSSPPSPDGKHPTKDHLIGPCKPTATTISGSCQPQHKEQKETGPASKQAEPIPLVWLPAKAKTLSTTIHTQPPSQSAPSTLKKKVSFPDSLTRGPGTSYTPPEGERALRSSTSLVRDEAPRDDGRNVKRDLSTATNDGRRASSPRKLGSNVSQVPPDERLALDIGDTPEYQATAFEFDLESESDDSFTDVVNPIKAVETFETETGPRRQPTYHSGHKVAETMTSRRSSRPMQTKVSDGQSGYYMTEALDNEPSPTSFDISNKRCIGIPEKDRSYCGIETSCQGTATASSYNRRGHKLRPSPTDTGILRQSSGRRWPEPLFIWEDTTATSVMGRPNPTFALRERSESQKNSQASGRSPIVKTSQQQPERKEQPPWDVDEVVDRSVRYDPTSKRTYRDV